MPRLLASDQVRTFAAESSAKLAQQIADELPLSFPTDEAVEKCFANPGPDCFIHQDELARPASYDVEGPSAREYLSRLMQAQPTPLHERAVA